MMSWANARAYFGSPKANCSHANWVSSTVCHTSLVTAGSDVGTTTYIPIPEIYNPVTNSFSRLTNANQVIPNYPFMFVLPDGRVLAAGSDESPMATYALNVATQTWSVVDPTAVDGGSSAMYAPGKILKSGRSVDPGKNLEPQMHTDAHR